jgi:hypothetical protein
MRLGTAGSTHTAALAGACCSSTGPGCNWPSIKTGLELPAPYAAQCQGRHWCLRACWLVGAVGATALQHSVGARQPPKQAAAELQVLTAAMQVGD